MNTIPINSDEIRLRRLRMLHELQAAHGRRKMTQKRISENLGYTRTYFSNWLNGGRRSKRLAALFSIFYRNNM